MARPYTGKVSEEIQERTQKNGDVYVFKVIRWYDRETRNTKRRCTLLGIKNPGTGEIEPTRPRRKQSSFEPETTPVSALIKKNAMISIIEHFSDVSEVTAEVMEALPEDSGSALKILTLAWYAFATDGRTWTRANKWTSDYLPLLPYKYGCISKDMYTDLFHLIGCNDGIKWSIFKRRAKRFGEGELIAWDSTVYECGVDDVHDSQKAPTKEGRIADVYKIFFFYSVTSRKLLAFVKIPGKIADCATVSYAISAIKVLELKKPVIIQDNGYTDDNTLGELLHQKLHFITRILPSRQWVKAYVEKYRSALADGQKPARIVFCDPEFSGVSCKVKHTFYYIRKYKSHSKEIEAGTKEAFEAYVNLFIYFSSYKKGLDDKEFRTNYNDIRSDILSGCVLDDEAKKFRDSYMDLVYDDSEVVDVLPVQKNIDMHFRYHGFLVLASDCENDIDQALLKYRSREKIEERIKGHKSHTGGDTTKTGNDEFLEGELLVEFLADTIRESMLVKIHALEQELGTLTGEGKNDGTEEMKQCLKLKRWLRSKTIANILDTFDTTNIQEIESDGKSSKLVDSTTYRNRLFLSLLGIEDWGKP